MTKTVAIQHRTKTESKPNIRNVFVDIRRAELAPGNYSWDALDDGVRHDVRVKRNGVMIEVSCKTAEAAKFLAGEGRAYEVVANTR